MAHAIKVRGRLSHPLHIELDEPVNDLSGSVDLLVQKVDSAAPAGARTLFGMCADLGPAPSSAEIDEGRREMWAAFPRDDI